MRLSGFAYELRIIITNPHSFLALELGQEYRFADVLSLPLVPILPRGYLLCRLPWYY